MNIGSYGSYGSYVEVDKYKEMYYTVKAHYYVLN